MIGFVSADTVSEAYVRLLNLVMRNGRNEIDGRDDYVKECLNVTTTIHNPFELQFNIPRLSLPDGLAWNKEMLMIYEEQFINPENHGFIYTYGERLRNHGGHDQINEIINELNNDQSSRRAVACTWNVELDHERDEVPCLQFIQFNIRQGKIDCTALWRSHDIYGAWFVNIVGLRNLMQYVHNHLTDKTVKLGEITVHSVSAHIHYEDFNATENIINKNRRLL